MGRFRFIAVPVVAGLLTLAVFALAPSSSLGRSGSASVSGSARATAMMTRLRFHDAMRKLWEEHVAWTRLFIVSFAAGLPDQDATAARLLQNQVDIGDAVKPFYGKVAGNQLTALLKQHILTAVDLLTRPRPGT